MICEVRDMPSDTKTTKYAFLSALVCAVGATVLGCSADDSGTLSSKKDAGTSTTTTSGAGGSSSTTTTTSGAGGSGVAGNFGSAGTDTTTGAGGSGNAGTATTGGGGGGMDCTTDSDGDGTPDCKDQCMFDKTKTMPGICGCGTPDVASGDITGDGGIDCIPGLYVEAETGTLTSSDAGAATDGGSSAPFTVGNDANAAGGKYIVSPAGLDDGLPGQAHAGYKVNIPADGMYVIWGRFYTPSRDHNRIWMRVDSGVWQRMLSTSGEAWFWFAFHKDNAWDMPISFQLTKGMHTFDIANDTDGVKIDRFYLTSAGDKPKAMTGDDTSCNPPHTVAINSVCQQSCGMLGGTSCDAVLCQGKTLLPAYDCAVCCAPGAGDAATE
jgi:hypothetical protein